MTAAETGGRTIARTALLLLPLQIAFRGGEALLPLLLATWFGRGPETDSYYLLASYFVFTGAILTGAFQDSAVVPVLVQTRNEAPAELPELVGAMLGRTLRIATALALGMGGLAAGYTYLSSSFPPSAKPLAWLLSLGVILIAARACLVGVLNALGLFRAHPIASGFGMLISLTLTFSLRSTFGICAIPIGTLAGEATAIIVLGVITKSALGVFPTPTRKEPERLGRIQSLVQWEVMGSLITRINPVLDQMMVGMAGVVGGGTVLRYANDLASIPTSLLQATLLPVFLTQVAAKAHEDATFARTVRGTLVYVTGILVGLSLLFFWVRVPLSRLLFLHGAMDEAGVLGIASALPYALLGVAPFGALLVLARAHVALQNTRIMPSMGVINACSNAALNYALVGRFGIGGIALSTSLTYVIVSVVFWFRLPRQNRNSR